jgi:hypothetical protein
MSTAHSLTPSLFSAAANSYAEDDGDSKRKETRLLTERWRSPGLGRVALTLQSRSCAADGEGVARCVCTYVPARAALDEVGGERCSVVRRTVSSNHERRSGPGLSGWLLTCVAFSRWSTSTDLPPVPRFLLFSKHLPHPGVCAVVCELLALPSARAARWCRL